MNKYLFNQSFVEKDVHETTSSGKNMAGSLLNMEMCSICTNPSTLQMFIFIYGFAIIFAVSFIYRSASF